MDYKDWDIKNISVEMLEDHSDQIPSSEGFMRLRRLVLRNQYDDGQVSEPYRYDIVERALTDAVIVAIIRYQEKVPYLCLRSSLRPPLFLRSTTQLPIVEKNIVPILWELPAGLIEKDEVGEEGIRACAAREVMEETGFAILPNQLQSLGPSVFLSPGVIAERIYFFSVEITSETAKIPEGDGSPLEDRAQIQFVPLQEAIAACNDGRMIDAKSEVAIRRLAERLL